MVARKDEMSDKDRIEAALEAAEQQWKISRGKMMCCWSTIVCVLC